MNNVEEVVMAEIKEGAEELAEENEAKDFSAFLTARVGNYYQQLQVFKMPSELSFNLTMQFSGQLTEAMLQDWG